MANFTRQAYDPKNQKIIFGGIDIGAGIGDGEFLSIKPNTDISNYVAGVDGDIHTNLISDNTGVATVRMAYDNPPYRLMRAAAVAYKSTGIFLPFLSTNIVDLLDTTSSVNANIIRHSTDNYAYEASNMIRTYDILLHNVIRV